MKKIESKDRYVLGVGYPWEASNPEKGTYIGITNDIGCRMKRLKIPKSLLRIGTPMYRLILERMKNETKS